MDIVKGQSFIGFTQRFKTEEYCKKYLSELKWDKGFVCRKCGHKGSQIPKDFFRTCNKCSDTESPSADTLFHKIKFGLLRSFYSCFKVLCSSCMLLLRVGLFFFICFAAVGQGRNYATIFNGSDPTNKPIKGVEFGCDAATNGVSCNFSLNRPRIADHDLSSFGIATFLGSSSAFFDVYFYEEELEYNEDFEEFDVVGRVPVRNKRIGIKLGFDDNALGPIELDYLIRNITLYAVDDFSNIIFKNGSPVELSFDISSVLSNLKLGSSTFEIVVNQPVEEFYGIRLQISNDGTLTNKPFHVYEFYILGTSCDDYFDFVYTNSLGNNGLAIQVTSDTDKDLELDPKSGSFEVSFLFDSYSYMGDSVSMIFENIPGLTISNLSNYFEVQAYSDNTALGLNKISINSENSKLSSLGTVQELTFPINVSFNRIKLYLKQELKLSRMFRKTGGEPLRIIPNVAVNADGKYVYREGEPIVLLPSIPYYTGSDYKWCFDLACDLQILNGRINDVDYAILPNGSLEINNLPFIESFIVYLQVIDPVSGCEIIKRIDFEVEGIVLPLMDFDLKGKMLPNQTVQLNWKFEPSEEYRIENLILEKAKDDLLFFPISGLYDLRISNEFSFIDVNPFNGNNFYRLSSYSEILGKYIFSDVINIQVFRKNSQDNFILYPNPVKDYLSFDHREGSLEDLELVLFSLDGRENIRLSDLKVEKKSSLFQIDLSFLKKGVYILTIRTSSYFGSHKIIKE